jgi:proline iminopeptidase
MEDRPRRGTVRRVLGCALACVAVAAAQGALIVALVAAGSSPPAAIAGALVVTGASCVLVGWLVVVRRRRRRRRSQGSVSGADADGSGGPELRRVLGSAVAVWLVAIVLAQVSFLRLDLAPMAADAASQTPVVDIRRTGTADAGVVPIVAVQGGPGVPWSAVEERALLRLAGDRPLVVYDQVGTGGSARLADPSDYTFARSVGELAAIVDETGAERVDLVGFSWGAAVATAFAVDHPERVGRVVLLSPGSIPWAGEVAPSQAPQSRLTTAGQIGTYLLALSPRNLFGYALTAVDPRAAHWFAGDDEFDGRFAELYDTTAAGLHCEESQVGAPPRGLGYYANQVPQLHPDLAGISAAQAAAAHLRMLVFRGECDYIAARFAEEYVEVFDARLVRVEGAGHSLLEDRPEQVLEQARAFLG